MTNGGFESGGTGWTQLGYSGWCLTTNCEPDYPRTGSGWGVLGGDSNPMVDPNNAPAFLRTNVTITGTPATLNFYVRVIQGGAGQLASMQASIDSQPVAPAISSTDGTFATYKLVSANVAAFADGAPHTLAFAFSGSSPGAVVRPQYVIDDVSLSIPDPPPTQPTPPTPDPDPTPDPTPNPDPTPEPPKPVCKGKVATIVGSDEGQLLDGTPQADVIFAGAGNDVVRAGAGNDVVCAGAGNDEVKGASGRDRLYGDEGRDKLNGGGGEGDRCVGGPSRDKATQSCEKSKTL